MVIPRASRTATTPTHPTRSHLSALTATIREVTTDSETQ
jgi:hypothetical protein